MYNISISGYGGQYALGSIEDISVFNFLRERLEDDGELKAWYFESDYEELEYDIEFLQFDDIISKCNAGRDASIEIYDANNNLITTDKDFQFKYYAKSNPYPYHSIEEFKENGVVGYFGGASIEKGGFLEYELETNDFHPEYIRILLMNLDETLCNDEVIEKILYISDQELCDIFNKEYKNEYGQITTDMEEFDDYMKEMFSDSNTDGDLDEFFDKYALEGNADNASTTGKSSFAVLYDENYERFE